MSDNNTDGYEYPSENHAMLANRRAELEDGYLEAYAAGFAKALEQFDIETELPNDVRTLKEVDFIQESHFYYWEGRVKPLSLWLPVQFDVHDYDDASKELEPVNNE